MHWGRHLRYSNLPNPAKCFLCNLGISNQLSQSERINMEPSDDLLLYDQQNKSNLSEAYEDYHSNAIDTKLFEKYYKNRSVSDTAFWTLVVSYSVLITVGTLGNLFVMSAVIRNNSKYFFSAFWDSFRTSFGTNVGKKLV